MGLIRQDIFDNHLRKYPREADLLKPFLSGFDVTWAGRHKAFNTELSTYFLKPEKFIEQMFGFEHEVVLFISDFPALEARTMQATESVLMGDPARGRVDQSIFFLCSRAGDGREWVADYTARNPQARIPVVFDSNDLLRKTNANDPWLVRNIIRGQLFSRDLFDYQLPLDSDLFFFGRDQVVADHLDAIRRSQNRGLFGLRKTGKTSVLYKLQRMAESEHLGAFLYYDCKLPSIRMRRWNEFLARIIEDIARYYGLSIPSGLEDARYISDKFIEILQRTPASSVTTLVFDEIEYVSPLAVDDAHWHKDFIPFWQTLWAAQSQVRRLSNIIVGVNPQIVEADTVGEIQNPMFGIIQPKYLQGLAIAEVRSMVRFFGRRMGLNFTPDACEYLHERYGGHPLLTRMACSEIHQEIQRQGVQRPVELTRAELAKAEDNRDAELVFYCRHVVSELKKFYGDEYSFLEILASKQVVDAMELADQPEYTRHLKEYGLLRVDAVGRPSIAIPVVGVHVGNELARRENRRLVRSVVAAEKRANWVRRRTEMISREIRELCRVSDAKNLITLFGGYSFPEAERFLAIEQTTTNEIFVNFINICNRCFVESVEMYGRQQGKPDYFWTTVKQYYPDLWDGLHRVKLYRHNDLHLELKPAVEVELRKYIETDLEGRRIAQVPDVWFVLQQSVLDGLLLGVQCELNRYS